MRSAGRADLWLLAIRIEIQHFVDSFSFRPFAPAEICQTGSRHLSHLTVLVLRPPVYI